MLQNRNLDCNSEVTVPARSNQIKQYRNNQNYSRREFLQKHHNCEASDDHRREIPEMVKCPVKNEHPDKFPGTFRKSSRVKIDRKVKHD